MSDKPLGGTPTSPVSQRPGWRRALIAVTVSLHPGPRATPRPSYTVRPGDTLSAIAARAYPNAADWAAAWRANRRQVPDPAMITAGEPLHLPGSPQVPPWLARAARAARAAIAAPPAPAPHAPAAPPAPPSRPRLPRPRP